MQELFGNRAGFAVADASAVEFDEGNELCRGSREEAFVRRPDVETRERLFDDFNAEPLRDVKHRAARHAAERAAADGRRNELVFENDEHVVAAAFRDVAFVVEQQAFLIAQFVGFDFRENVVEVVEALDHGGQRRVRVSARGNGDCLQALFVRFVRVKLDLVGDDYKLRVGAGEGREAQLAFAARDNQADIAVGEVVCAAGVADGVGDFLFCPGQVEHDCLRAAEESVHVHGQAEDVFIVEADTLEDTVAVHKAVVENRHFCVVFVVVFSVDVNFHCLLFCCKCFCLVCAAARSRCGCRKN